MTENNKGPEIGIEKISVYPCTLGIDMPTLVAARGQNVAEVCTNMMIDQRSLNPPWEDPVTMAVNAAQGMLSEADRQAITLLLVASESGLDQEKSLSTWVHRYLGLSDACRNLEIKHACYAGTAGLRLATAWLLAHPDPAAKALVIATDQSRSHFGKPYEFVMGAGSVALLISRKPSFFSLDHDLGGVYTYEVSDLTRPTSLVEAGHSETSLLSYLDAVDLTFGRYAQSLEQYRGVTISSLAELAAWFPRQVYHAPFGGITRRAHKSLLRSLPGYDKSRVGADFAQRIEPTLEFNRRMGGTYAASVFISLLAAAASLAEADPAGARCGIYSYGSGSCAEFYSGRCPDPAAAQLQAAVLRAALDQRKQLTVAGYEEAESRRHAQIDQGDFQVGLDGLDDWYRERYQGKHLLTFRGAEDFVRAYEWS